MGDKKPERVGALKEGRYVIIDDEPCKIEKIQTSAPGKHGSAKSRIDARGIFDNKRRSIVKPVNVEYWETLGRIKIMRVKE